MLRKVISIMTMVVLSVMILSVGSVMAAASAVQATVNGVSLNTSSLIKISEGQTIKLTSNGASKIAYKIGTSAVSTVNGSTYNLVIPASYTNTGTFTLQAIGYAADGTASATTTYYLDVTSTTSSAKPVVVLKVNDAVLSTSSRIIIDENQAISVVPTSANGISKIEYKIGTSAVKTINSASASIVIPTTYTNSGTFSLQVIAYSANGVASNTATYYLEVKKDVNTSVSEVVATVNGTTLNAGSLIKVDEGQAISLSATNGAKIYYKIGTSYTNSIAGSNGTIVIPTTYTNSGTFTLQVYAILNDGTQTLTKTYYIQVVKETVGAPTLELSVNGNILSTAYKTIISEGQEIAFKTNGSMIQYKVGTSAVQTVNSSTGVIVIPTEYSNTGAFSLQVIAYSEDNTTSPTATYYMEVKAGSENTVYPFIILKDEKLNSKLDGLNISLRTVPVTTKSGNMNYILLNEYVQYNIDFINSGKSISDKVYVTFEIPTGFSVKIADAKGGVVNGNTITWSFNGLVENEKGTIPVTLYYTKTQGSGAVATPVAKISTGSVMDTSSVWNFVIKNSTSTVDVNHTPFMIGDGEDANTFRPNDGLNRAEMAMILVRILNLDLVKDDTITYKDAAAFQDGKYAWSKSAVMTVTKAGLMTGYDDGTFQPASKLTKAQVITIVARALELQNKNVIDSPLAVKEQPIKLFNNLSVTYTSYGFEEHWAAKYLAQLIRLNMLPDFANTIDGNLDIVITRAETAKLICTMLTRGPSIDVTANTELTNSFIDVDLNTTYYEYIVETTADQHDAQYQKNGWEKIVK